VDAPATLISIKQQVKTCRHVLARPTARKWRSSKRTRKKPVAGDGEDEEGDSMTWPRKSQRRAPLRRHRRGCLVRTRARCCSTSSAASSPPGQAGLPASPPVAGACWPCTRPHLYGCIASRLAGCCDVVCGHGWPRPPRRPWS
jgi:hypothetical protein